MKLVIEKVEDGVCLEIGLDDGRTLWVRPDQVQRLQQLLDVAERADRLRVVLDIIPDGAESRLVSSRATGTIVPKEGHMTTKTVKKTKAATPAPAPAVKAPAKATPGKPTGKKR